LKTKLFPAKIPKSLATILTRQFRLSIISWVVPTKQCGSIISKGYISWLLVAHGEKSGVYKAKKVDIFKPALLCRDYQKIGECVSVPL